MSIPIGMDYSSTVEGSTFKQVTCEQCQLRYVYLARRQASGKSSSLLFLDNSGAKERAQDKALMSLEKLLERAIDPVPCVGCGWMQKDMVREARRRFHRWALVAGRASALLGALLLTICHIMDFSRPLLLNAGAIGLVGGVVLMVLRAIMLVAYNPNAPHECEKWAAKAAGTAMTLEDLQAVRAGQRAQEHAVH